MYRFPSNGFTLIEIMTVTLIIGILAGGIFIATQPYMKRARDTKRVTSIQSYLANIIVAYEKNFDTFPSNYGSGGSAFSSGYCLSELPTRPDVLAPGGVSGKDGRFTALMKDTSAPPSDPTEQIIDPLCSMSGSYVYSRMKYGTDNEIALVVARLEVRSSANYGTGTDLTDSGKIQELIGAKKSTVPNSATDQLYIVTSLH